MTAVIARRSRRNVARSINLFDYIDISDGCWLWTARKNNYGYGLVRHNTKAVLVHRYTYELYKEPIKPELQIDHLCRVRACCNPLHLEAVTLQENARRGETVTAINRQKTHCLRNHPLYGDNLYVENASSGPKRHCKTCRALRQKRRIKP